MHLPISFHESYGVKFQLLPSLRNLYIVCLTASVLGCDGKQSSCAPVLPFGYFHLYIVSVVTSVIHPHARGCICNCLVFLSNFVGRMVIFRDFRLGSILICIWFHSSNIDNVLCGSNFRN